MFLRKTWTTVAALAATFALTLSGCASNNGAETSTEANKPTTVRMAVTDLQGMEELQREFGAFKSTYEEVSGQKLEFFPVNDRAAAAVALRSNQVDLVFTGPAEYVAIHERTKATPVVSINRPGYHSVIYTKKDAGVNDVAALRGKNIAMSDVGSTSGHLGPSQLLQDAGLDPLKDVKVLTVGDTVHEALKRGDVAAVGIGHHDYEEFMEKDDPAKYTILVEGKELPPDVIMARESLDPQTRDQVKKAFVEHWDKLLPAMLQGKDNTKYKGASIVQTKDSDYDVIRKMYRSVGVTDFANAPE